GPVPRRPHNVIADPSSHRRFRADHGATPNLGRSGSSCRKNADHSSRRRKQVISSRTWPVAAQRNRKPGRCALSNPPRNESLVVDAHVSAIIAWLITTSSDWRSAPFFKTRHNQATPGLEKKMIVGWFQLLSW